MSSQWVTHNARTLLQGFCLAYPLLGIRYYHTRREIPLLLSALLVVFLPSVLLTISKNKPILLLNSIAIFWSQYQQNKNTFGYTITIFKCMYHIKLFESSYHSLKSTKILITLEALLNSL